MSGKKQAESKVISDRWNENWKKKERQEKKEIFSFLFSIKIYAYFSSWKRGRLKILSTDFDDNDYVVKNKKGRKCFSSNW